MVLDAGVFTTTLPKPRSADRRAAPFTARFAPTDVGARTATLHLASNDATQFTLTLTGYGLDTARRRCWWWCRLARSCRRSRNVGTRRRDDGQRHPHGENTGRIHRLGDDRWT
jgi:hypothetical protein